MILYLWDYFRCAKWILPAQILNTLRNISITFQSLVLLSFLLQPFTLVSTLSLLYERRTCCFMCWVHSLTFCETTSELQLAGIFFIGRPPRQVKTWTMVRRYACQPRRNAGDLPVCEPGQLLSHTSARPCLRQQTCNFPITNPHWNCFDGIGNTFLFISGLLNHKPLNKKKNNDLETFQRSINAKSLGG